MIIQCRRYIPVLAVYYINDGPLWAAAGHENVLE